MTLTVLKITLGEEKKNRNVNLFCFLFQFSMLFFKYDQYTGVLLKIRLITVEPFGVMLFSSKTRGAITGAENKWVTFGEIGHSCRKQLAICK